MALLLATRTLRASEVDRGCYHTPTTGFRLNTIGKDAVLVKIINSYPIVLDTCLSRRILNWSPKGDESN